MTDRQKARQGEDAVKNIDMLLEKSDIPTKRALEERLGYSFGSLNVALQRMKKGNISSIPLDKWLLLTELLDCKMEDLLGDI